MLKKFFQRKEKSKGSGCCSFNLEDEISKVSRKEEKEKAEKSSCCDFNLDAEIDKVKNKRLCCD